MGIAGGINLYAYVNANPLIRTDPTGLTPEEVQKAQKVLETLCDCKCLACSPEECKAEAKQIAVAYVDMFYAKKTWRARPGAWLTGDYNYGWMCYQWQTHTFNALEPIVKKGKCFDIRRVGLVTYHAPRVASITMWPAPVIPMFPWPQPKGYYTLDHNWVAISAVRKSPTTHLGAAPARECTVYLDPWMGGASGVYLADKEHHVVHNFQVLFTNGPDTAPTDVRGYVLPTPGQPYGESETDRNTRDFDGWTW